MLNSILNLNNITLIPVLVCLLSAVALGVIASLIYGLKNVCSRSLRLTLALLPLVSATVILVVNGNLGAGIAIAGAFSLVRFRSAQGKAQDILAVFLTMALGLCCGAGYVAIACILLAIYAAAVFLLDAVGFGRERLCERALRITVPESLDYEGLFDEVLAQYTRRYSLEGVRTAEMGSVYRLEYLVTLPGPVPPRAMLDAIRERNGNLEVLCSRVPEKHDVM